VQLNELKERIGNHDAQLNQIYEALENLLDEKVEVQQKKNTWTNRERIGFKK
jgi:FtsZ-binding cell division protein ZapB